jgi:hypothetical protein
VVVVESLPGGTIAIRRPASILLRNTTKEVDDGLFHVVGQRYEYDEGM